jgi:hypothetical protein
MNKRDLTYYRGRLAAERRAALSADNPAVARRHRQLAEEYIGLIEASGETATEEPAH